MRHSQCDHGPTVTFPAAEHCQCLLLISDLTEGRRLSFPTIAPDLEKNPDFSCEYEQVIMMVKGVWFKHEMFSAGQNAPELYIEPTAINLVLLAAHLNQCFHTVS